MCNSLYFRDYAFNQNKRILLIDWDLEAPGLHNYFNIKTENINAGLMDLMFAYTALMRKDEPVNEQILIEKKLFADSRHILKPFDNKKSCIHLMPAGKYNDDYFRRTNSFDWTEFYDTFDGKIYIELFKQHLNSLNYDYIFIDSRTGVNDYSGHILLSNNIY